METPQTMNDRPPRYGLYDAIYAASTFVVANLLWVICSLPLVTLPAATGALFSVLAPWARGEPTDSPLMVFFGAMRRYWRASTALFGLGLVAGGVGALNLLILSQMGVEHPLAFLSLGMTLATLLGLVIFNVYAWPLMVTQELTIRALFRRAARLGIAHPLPALLTALLALVPLVVTLFLPQIFWITVSFAAPVLVINWGAWRVLRRYVDEDSIHTLRG